MKFSTLALAIALALLISLTVFIAPVNMEAQAISGDLTGVVTDTSGAVVPNIAVRATNLATGLEATSKTNTTGEYHFINLPVGHYNLKVSGNGLTGGYVDVEVQLNKQATANIAAGVSTQTTSVEVTAEGATIDTTTQNIQNTFEQKSLQDLPTASTGLGVLNLSLLNAGVASAGGIGVGMGPSVSGQRPRNNNFTVEGVDNNSKSVTGAIVTIPNDAVENFTVLQNQFSPEFGHSSGGQFNQTIRGGTNSFHGVAYGYFNNRNLNAQDTLLKNQGITVKPPFDDNRYGGQIGGPIIKNKLFFFTNNEYQTIRQLTAAGLFVCAPTAAGYATINGLPNISATNLAEFQKYIGTATTVGDGGNCNPAYDISPSLPGGIETGEIDLSGPNDNTTFTTTNSIDYDISQKDQLRGRYVYQRNPSTDIAANLPVFYTQVPVKNYLLTLSEYHTFSPSVSNEFRLGFNRNAQNFPVTDAAYPGLDQFPNLVMDDTFNQIGPDGNAPQFGIQNIYQATDNVSWVRGKHNFKFGIEGRKYISPQGFTQRSRGDYEYSTTLRFLEDEVPDDLGQRSTGSNTYYGDQSAIYAYGNDQWRITPNLTIDLGLRYEFTSVPFTERQQDLNLAASVPGLISFAAPQPQYKNFAPRVGFAYSPGASGNTSIRGGFGMAYDVLFDNLGLLTVPPQFGATCDVGSSTNGVGGCTWGTTGFLANGGLPPGSGSGLISYGSPADARAATSGQLPNQQLPYSENWNLGIQHVFARTWTAEVRYVGTRGVHLPVQQQLDIQPKVSASMFLPTFLTSPDPATIAGLTTTLADFDAVPNVIPAYTAAGFGGAITTYRPLGSSIYHGLQSQLTRNFNHGLQMQAAYTWSHAIDDSTAEVFSTVLTPRRPQNSQDIAAERSDSALDRRHRLSLEAIYDMPFFKNSNYFERNILGNWEIAPQYIIESPEFFTAQSGTDSDLNGDSAPDRPIFNPGGIVGTGSAVTPVFNSPVPCADPNDPDSCRTVGYVAVNPKAQYIQAGPGALSNVNRNTVPSRRINNWDLTVVKRLKLTERMGFEFQAQALNLLNHAQYIPGSINTVNTISNTSITGYVRVNSDKFNQPELAFSNNPRILRLVAKFTF